MTRDDHDSKVDNDNRNIIYANSTDTMSQEKFVEKMRNDFGLNDDQIMNSIKILNSGKKIKPEKLGVDVVPFMQAYEESSAEK